MATSPITPKTPHGSTKDPEYRKIRARNASLAKWENTRLRRQLEAMDGSAALLLGRIELKDAAFLAKWPRILELIRHYALEKEQPWAIKMFKEIKDDFVKRATQELENKRDSRKPQVSVSIQNALIQMPVGAKEIASDATKQAVECSPIAITSPQSDAIEVPCGTPPSKS